jgi:hypothetical protein
MGWRVCFFGFNRPPATDVLQKTQWLTSWRLFHEPETGASFLEGQSESDEITFSNEVKTADRLLTDDQKALLVSIDNRITENGGYKQLFDTYAAEIAMLLSQELNQPVASFVGDDEGTESCFIFDQGKLVRGRLEIHWNKALAFDADGNAELEWLYPEGLSGNDPDFINSRTFFQIGIEEADAFFERHTLDDTLTFDHDFKPGQFVLKAQKGEPDLPIRRPIDELNDILGLSPTTEQILEAFAPVVDAILDEGFPDAPNAHRFEMDDRSTALSVYLSNLRQRSSQHSAFAEGLHPFVLDLSVYTKRLRPAPEFRKSSIDFRHWRQKLSAEWRRKKLPNEPWFRKLFRPN